MNPCPECGEEGVRDLARDLLDDHYPDSEDWRLLTQIVDQFGQDVEVDSCFGCGEWWAFAVA